MAWGRTEREEIHCHGIFPGGICNRNDYVSDVYRKHCLSGRYGAGYLVLAGIAILGIIIAKVYYIQETCRGI